MTENHPPQSNVLCLPGIQPPSRRSFFGLAAAVPVLAAGPALAALPAMGGGERFAFFAVLWSDHGGLVGIGRTEDEAWALAAAELLCTSEMCELEPHQTAERLAAETFAECRKEAPCMRVEARDEAEGYAIASMLTQWSPPTALRIWRRAFPVDGPDPIAAALGAEEEDRRTWEAERKAEEAARETRWREEAEARRAAEPPKDERIVAAAAVFAAMIDARDHLDVEQLRAVAAAIRAGGVATLSAVEVASG